MSSERPFRLLFDAVEAGRAALRDRDDLDVPAKLRAVAASSSRSLPPPLSRRLLNELDADSTLRAEAADLLGDSAGRASVLFLSRPAGWEEEYEDLVSEYNSHAEEQAAARDVGRIAELERELKAARAKAKDALKRAEAAEAHAEARIGDSRRDIKKAGKAAAARAAELERNLATSEKRREDLAEELAALRSEVASLRIRREKVKGPDVDDDRLPTASDPVSMATALDHLLIRAQQHHEPPGLAETGSRHLALPPGIAPDRADAVEWLLSSGIPQVWIVDGHNLAHRFDPSRFSQPELRGEIAEALARMRRRSFGPFRAVIVFDTGAPVGDRVQAASGVELMFVGDADAEVVDLAGIHGHGAVVVSSDREVRQGASKGGAVVIWSEAVVEFLRS